jgi:hypothetical protein
MVGFGNLDMYDSLILVIFRSAGLSMERSTFFVGEQYLHTRIVQEFCAKA